MKVGSGLKNERRAKAIIVDSWMFEADGVS